MKILFIYPDMITRDPLWQGYYYEGIALLSAVAREAGHDTVLLHVWEPMSAQDVLEWVEEQSEGDRTLVAFSATENQFPHIRRWVPLIKRETGLPTIVGGVYATLTPEEVVSCEGVDMICRGDGEKPLLELLDCLEAGTEPRGVQGIWYRDASGSVVRQPMASLTDLSTLPPPHWEIFPTLHSLEWFREAIAVQSGSRGCPYECAFCCAKTLQVATGDAGNYVRLKPVPQLIAELTLYLERYPQTCGFVFEDDIFGMSVRWLREFRQVYPVEVARPFGCNVRPDMLTEERIGLYLEAGCQRVHMGVDAGNDAVRNQTLNRRVDRETLLEAFRICKKVGLEARAYNIIGSPNETARDILETIKINAEIESEFVQHTVFYPYNGTPLHDTVIKEGMLAPDREVNCYFQDTALDQESIRREQVLMFNEHFQGLVRHYRRLRKLPSPLHKAAAWCTDRLFEWRGAPRVTAAVDRGSRFVRRLASSLPRRGNGRITDGRAARN